MKRSALLGCTHALCLAAGLLAAHQWMPEAGKTQPARQATATRASDRSEPPPSGLRSQTLASEALAELKAAKTYDEAAATASSMKFSTPGAGEAEVRKLTANGTKPPPNGAEFAGAFLAWFHEDSHLALAFLQTAAGSDGYDAVLKQALSGLSLKDHLDLVSAPDLMQMRKKTASALGERLSGTPVSEAAQFLRDSGMLEKRAALMPLTAGWPAGNSQGFLDLALATGQVSLIQSYMSSAPQKASALYLLLQAQANLPQDFQDFQDFLANSAELRGHLYRYADPAVSIEQRVEEMKNLSFLKEETPENQRSIALKQISTVDIHELMQSDTDYRFAFRNGAMSAQEVLDAVKQQLPQMAAASEYETRVRVFNELASENATAAFALIADLPDETRNQAVLHQSRWSFRDNSPDMFLAMIDLAPGPDSAAAAPQRADAWNNYNESAYGEYSDAYLDWVRKMPPGINRDAARLSLSSLLEKAGQADLATEFKKP